MRQSTQLRQRFGDQHIPVTRRTQPRAERTQTRRLLRQRITQGFVKQIQCRAQPAQPDAHLMQILRIFRIEHAARVALYLRQRRGGNDAKRSARIHLGFQPYRRCFVRPGELRAVQRITTLSLRLRFQFQRLHRRQLQRQIEQRGYRTLLEFEFQLANRIATGAAANLAAVDRNLDQYARCGRQQAQGAFDVGTEHRDQRSRNVSGTQHFDQRTARQHGKIGARITQNGLEFHAGMHTGGDAAAAFYRLDPAPAFAPHPQRDTVAPQMQVRGVVIRGRQPHGAGRGGSAQQRRGEQCAQSCGRNPQFELDFLIDLRGRVRAAWRTDPAFHTLVLCARLSSN